MNVLILILVAAAVLYAASRVYGRLVARWLGESPDRPTPAVELADGRDYVPTNPNTLFGHHFATIAGAGPIVGPTLAVLYGYLPVWLWVLIGGVLIGAVHDFSTLFVSLRERGRSMAEIARQSLGDRGFALFIGFAIVMIVLVTSAFLSMTAVSLTSQVPLKAIGLSPEQTLLRTVEDNGVVKGVIGGIASTSVIIITLLSPLLGYLLYRRRLATWLGYLFAAIIGLGSIYIGSRFPVTLNPTVWMYIISVYVMFAAGLPVWLLLQPRDFTNVQILYAGIVALVAGLVIGGFQGMTVTMAPVDFATGVKQLGSVWPMLFITVACGAISGFHALAATGTTAKQLAQERHARVIGFNGMLLESLLAVAVIITVGAALSREQYLGIVWPTVESGMKSNPILAFSLALGTMLRQTLHLPAAYGTVFGILLVEGFVVTTLDSAVRLNRYLFEELWPILFKGRVPGFFRLPWFNSALSVALMLALALTNGFTVLWPLFATGNQMLAALSLIAVSAWLLSRRRQAWFTLLPAAFMVVTTLASLLIQFMKFRAKLAEPLATAPASLFSPQLVGATTLFLVDILMMGLSIGVVVMALRVFARLRRQPAVAEAKETVGV